MLKLRQDAWSEEDDLMLAETVLRHVREGSTQLNAFDEVGDRLNRTSAACGFRWNAVVRQTYESALQFAKKQRKDRQRAIGQFQPVRKKKLYEPPMPSLTEIGLMDDGLEIAEIVSLPEPMIQTEATPRTELTINHVISFLQSYKSTNIHHEALGHENERLKRENRILSSENRELTKRIRNLEENNATIQEDYEAFMNIMNRARKMMVIEEEKKIGTTFRMDRNGNLEKVAE